MSLGTSPLGGCVYKTLLQRSCQLGRDNRPQVKPWTWQTHSGSPFDFIDTVNIPWCSTEETICVIDISDKFNGQKTF